jgi:TPR repeat protein
MAAPAASAAVPAASSGAAPAPSQPDDDLPPVTLDGLISWNAQHSGQPHPAYAALDRARYYCKCRQDDRACQRADAIDSALEVALQEACSGQRDFYHRSDVGACETLDGLSLSSWVSPDCRAEPPAPVAAPAPQAPPPPAPNDTRRCAGGRLAECERECEAGTALSCAQLGYMFLGGTGVARDLVKGTQYRKRACDLGEPNACSNLAWQYMHAVGVEKDLAIARTYAKKGCDGGDDVGCYNRDELAREAAAAARAAAPKPPPPQPPPPSVCVRGHVDACTRECNAGKAKSCAELGYTFVDGVQVARDPAKSAAYRKQACDLGEFNACGNLAWQYIQGVGVAKDMKAAQAVAAKGCRGGDAVSCTNLRAAMGVRW